MQNVPSISVVMPAYNEAEGIARVVQDFLAQPQVSEVVVIDNNSSDGTADIAKAAGARVVFESRQGYGFACMAALAAATSDIVIITESDRTFYAPDITKFLAYSGEFDVVFGTRTSKSCIWSGANMTHFLRYGNIAVGKLLEYVHNGPSLSDVGCTFKLFHRESLQDLLPHLTVGGSHLGPEIMMTCIRSGLRCVEIPVHYRQRLGTSKITGSQIRAFRLGCRIIWMILQYRFKRFPQLTSRVTVSALTEG